MQGDHDEDQGAGDRARPDRQALVLLPQAAEEKQQERELQRVTTITARLPLARHLTKKRKRLVARAEFARRALFWRGENRGLAFVLTVFTSARLLA